MKPMNWYVVLPVSVIGAAIASNMLGPLNLTNPFHLLTIVLIVALSHGFNERWG